MMRFIFRLLMFLSRLLVIVAILTVLGFAGVSLDYLAVWMGALLIMLVLSRICALVLKRWIDQTAAYLISDLFAAVSVFSSFHRQFMLHPIKNVEGLYNPDFPRNPFLIALGGLVCILLYDLLWMIDFRGLLARKMQKVAPEGPP